MANITNTREYVERLTLTISQIEKLEECQRQSYRHGFETPNQANLAAGLGPVSTVLGIIALIKNHTPTGVASAIIGIVSGLTNQNQLSAIDYLVKDGYLKLGYLKDDMRDNRWQAVRIDLPFIEFVDEKIRFISGKGSVQAYYQDGVWVE